MNKDKEELLPKTIMEAIDRGYCVGCKERKFTPETNICPCGVYRVNKDNYDKTITEIYGNTKQVRAILRQKKKRKQLMVKSLKDKQKQLKKKQDENIKDRSSRKSVR